VCSPSATCCTPSDTADIAALDGRHVADHVRHYLNGRRPSTEGVLIHADGPLRWVAPSVVRPGDPAPARHRLLLWTDTLVRVPTVVAAQNGKIIGRKTLPWPRFDRAGVSGAVKHPERC